MFRPATFIRFRVKYKALITEYRCHMFYGQRVVDVPDGLPKWDGLNDESNLIEDSPPELVRELERKRVEALQKKEN